MKQLARKRLKLRIALALGLLLPTLAAHAQTADRSGAWWRADESGWGVFTVDQGDVLLPTWFTYDRDGQATWFIVSGALLQADGSYSGEVYRFTGVPFAQITGTAADPGQRVGTARLSFPDTRRMQFAYDIEGVSQSKALERFDWGSRDIACSASSADPATFDNYSALWWNTQQNGWGMQLNHVDDLIAGTWFTFGEDRKPAWFVFTATRQADGRYTGSLNRGRSGLRFDQINGAPAVRELPEVGSVSLRFIDGARAEFSHTQGGVTQRVEISRAQFGSRVSACRSVDKAPTGGGNPGSGAGDQCFPPLRVGDRFLSADDTGGRIEQRITGMSSYKGREVFVLEDRIIGNANATVREFVQQTDTHRIYLGGEGYIPEAQTQGTYEYDPPVEIPRATPNGFALDLNYVIRNRYTSMGQAVSVDVSVDEQLRRTGSADITVPAGQFNGACQFENRIRLDSTTQVAGFSVRSQTDSLVKQFAHADVGPVRTERDTTSTATTSGAPVPIPPTVTRSQDLNQLIEATADGRDFP